MRCSYLFTALSLSTWLPPYEVAILIVVQRTRNRDQERLLLSTQLYRSQFYRVSHIDPTKVPQLLTVK
ncbi:hypothetical protein T440DRAFT_410761 [Plenodomus tracheiphilus IPT5]|uniref:Secreted protein n=1 Tax=Plenodomus tracheiphilus IPT5 TaxID=1408161 RepID=A0A6A7APA8_9PLEO|nr:hypothetical protein T440DRAFT_410761 [Plenodomus tracheiphilus IPT5]